MDAWLHHGRGNEPRLTERVEIRESILPWQAAGLTWTASGYGARIPTEYMVKYLGRWRRVYCCIYSNSGCLFIGKSLKYGISVQVER